VPALQIRSYDFWRCINLYVWMNVSKLIHSLSVWACGTYASLHRRNSEQFSMRSTATDVARSVVCVSVCLSHWWARKNGWTDRDAVWGQILLIDWLQGLNWGFPPDLRSGTFCWDPLPRITDLVPHNWDPAPICWDPPLCTVYIWVFFSMHNAWCFCKRCSPSRSFCHLHLSMLGVDRCCKR